MTIDFAIPMIFRAVQMHIYDIISLSRRAILSLLLRALLRNIILNYPSVLRLNNRTEKQEGGLEAKEKRSGRRER